MAEYSRRGGGVVSLWGGSSVIGLSAASNTRMWKPKLHMYERKNTFYMQTGTLQGRTKTQLSGNQGYPPRPIQRSWGPTVDTVPSKRFHVHYIGLVVRTFTLCLASSFSSSFLWAASISRFMASARAFFLANLTHNSARNIEYQLKFVTP